MKSNVFDFENDILSDNDIKNLPEEYVSNREAIIEANEIMKMQRQAVVTKGTIVNMQLEVADKLVDGSIVGTNPDITSQKALNEVIDDMFVEYANEHEELRTKVVDVMLNLRSQQMTLEEIHRANLGSLIIDINDKKDYDYYILTTPESIRAMIQLQIPAYNMMNYQWGTKTGPDARFDWSNYKPEDYLSGDRKLFLKTILRVDANGNWNERKSTYIPFHRVTAELKRIGHMMREANFKDLTGKENRYDLMKAVMEAYIDSGKIEDGYYLDDSVEVIHSIYTRIFGSYTRKDGYQSSPGYGIGLMEKYNSIISEYKAAVKRNMTDDGIVITNEINGLYEAANSVINFVNGIVTVYGSMYMMDMLKTTYYNDTVKTTHMFREAWISDRYRIENVQMNAIKNGELNEHTERTFNDTTFIDTSEYNDNKSITIKSIETNTDVLYYDGNEWVFINDSGSPTNSSNIERYNNVVKYFERIRSMVGLNIMRPGTFKRILKAEKWDEVTDSLIEVGNKQYANLFTDIRNSYNTPKEFIADYLGTVLFLYNQYRRSFKIEKVDENENTYSESVPLNVYLKNANIGNTINERINNVSMTDVILNFIGRTQPSSIELFEYTENSEVGSENAVEGTPDEYRYINFEDIFVSNNMIASIAQKVEGRVNDNARRTGEGTKRNPFITKSAMNEQFEKLENNTVNNITFISVVESLGITRNIGFTTYGTSSIETSDFIEQSLNLFAQGILKGEVFVPMKPASDTGNIRYFQIKAEFIDRKKGFAIDYGILGNAIKQMYENHRHQIAKSQERVKEFISILKTKKGFTSMVLDTEGLSISNMISKLNDHVKGKPELLAMLLEEVDHSSLVKDMSIYNQDTKESFFDIGYIGYYDEATKRNVITGIIPGRTATDNIKGMEWTNSSYRGSKYIDKLLTAISNNKLADIEKAVYSLFGRSYRRFADMVKDNDFDPVKSAYRLSNIANKGMIDKGKLYESTGKGKIKYNQIYFAYYMATMLANNGFETVGMDAYSFKGYMDNIKRFGSDNTPAITSIIGQRDLSGNPTGVLELTSPIMVARDILDSTEPTYKKRNGVEVFDQDKAIEVENGMTTLNPLWFTFFSKSFAGVDGTILGDSKALKPLGNMLRDDGSYLLLKSAFYVISSSDIQNKGYRQKFMSMLEQSDVIMQKRFYAENITSNVSYVDMFERHYNMSETKDLDKIMESMHLEILMWHELYGEKFYNIAVTSIVSMIAPVSTIKSPVRQVNNYDPLEDQQGKMYAYDTLDNSKLRAVLNPSQPTNTSKSQAQPSQFEAQMGVGDVDMQYNSKRYIKERADLQDAIEKEIKKEISMMTDMTGQTVPAGKRFSDIDFNKIDPYDDKQFDDIRQALEQLEKYLRKEVSADLAANENDLAYIDLLGDSNVSRHLPAMRQKFITSYRNMINNAVKGRTTGARMTQISGYYSRVYQNANGDYMMLNDVLDEVYADRGGWRSLTYEEYFNIDDNSLPYTEIPLYDMMPHNNIIKRGIVFMPNIYADKYGHRKDETLYQIMTVKIGNERVPILINGLVENEQILDKLMGLLKDSLGTPQYNKILFDFLNSPMIRKAIMNLGIYKDVLAIEQANNVNDPLSKETYDQLISRYDRIISGDLTIEEEIENDRLVNQRNAIEQYSGKQFSDMTVTEKIVYYLYDISNGEAIFNKELLGKIINNATTITADFNSSLTMMLSRVPLTFIGSGGLYQIAGFNNDNGNVVIIPPGMTNRNDADFDIDALTAYAYSIDNDGRKTVKGSGRVINKLNDRRAAVFTHIGNQKQILIKSNTDDIKGVLVRKADKSNKNRSYSKDELLVHNDPYSIFTAYDRNKAGADAIGILANALNAISLTLTLNLEGKSSHARGSMMDHVLSKNIKVKDVVMGMEGIIYRLGSWEQIALDNNKSNTLGDYNVKSFVVNVLASMVIDGMSNEQIYDFFNNENIIKIFKEAGKGERIINSRKKYDLYNIVKNEIEKFASKINSSPLTNWNAINNSKEAQNIIAIVDVKSTRQTLQRQTIEAIEAIDTRINQMLFDTIIDKVEGRKDNRYLNEKIDPEEGVAKFRRDNNITIEEILNGTEKLDDNMEEDIIKDSTLKQHVEAIKELYKKQQLIEAESDVKKLPKYIVMAEALFRISQIMKLRDGVQILDVDFKRNIIFLENMLGMTLKDYVGDANKVNTVEDHIRWFKQNNPRYLELITEYNRKNDSETLILMERLEEKERAVFNEVNISKMVRQTAQLDRAMRMVDQQNTLTQMMFLEDNVVFKQIMDDFLDIQKIGSMQFGNQIAMANNAIMEIVYDKFFTEIADVEVLQLNNTRYNFGNVFDRQEFALSFPAFVMRMQADIGKASFWSNVLSQDEFATYRDNIDKLAGNKFIEALTVTGNNRNKLIMNVETRDMSGVQLSEYQDAFKMLPDSIQRYFLYYELIENKMNYRTGSIMQVIGTDFYKGQLSEVMNDVYMKLFDIGLSVFTSDTNTLIERFYDYLGMNEEFAKYIPFDEPKGPELPRYIYNKGEPKKNRLNETVYGKQNIFYKRNSDGVYQVINKATWKPAISSSHDTSSPFVAFTRTFAEKEQYIENEKLGHVTQHIGLLSNIVVGQILRTGMDYVEVTRVKKGSISYRKATLESIDKWTNKLRQQEIKHNDNAVLLIPGTAEYNMFSIDAEVPVTITPSMALTVNGNQILRTGETFNTMQEMIMEFYNRVVKIIPNYNAEISSMTHAFNSIKRIFNQAISLRTFGTEQNINEKQMAVQLMIYGPQRLIKEAMKQRFASYEADDKNQKKLHTLVRDENNEFRKLNSKHNNMKIGKTTYTNLVHQAYKEYKDIMSANENEMLVQEDNILAKVDIENINTLFMSNADTISKIFSADSVQTSKVVESTDLRLQITSNQNIIYLVDNDNAYTTPAGDVVRLGSVIKAIRRQTGANDKTFANFTRMTTEQFNKLPVEQQEFMKKDYEQYKKGRLIVDRTKKDTPALKVGSAVDGTARNFFEWINNQIIDGKNLNDIISSRTGFTDVVHPIGMARFSNEQVEQLLEVLYLYANALVNYAKANKFEIEFISDNVPVYSAYNRDLVNALIDYEVNGVKSPMNGVGSALDLVVRFKSQAGGQTVISDMVLDFKTISAHRKGDSLKETEIEWAIQTYMSAMMYQDNYNVSLLNFNGPVYGIIPIQTSWDNGRIKSFGIPESIGEKVIAKNIMFWQNNTERKTNENFLPIYKANLYAGPRQLADKILGISADNGTDIIEEMYNNNEDSQDELNCK